MLRRNFWASEVEIDEETTAEWYAAKGPWDCECDDCQNFLKLARNNALPEPIRSVLAELGVPADKATYVCEIMPKDERTSLSAQLPYRRSYLERGYRKNTVAEWGEVRCCHEAYPYGAPDFPTPHFDLKFWVTLPWVLDAQGNRALQMMKI